MRLFSLIFDLLLKKRPHDTQNIIKKCLQFFFTKFKNKWKDHKL